MPDATCGVVTCDACYIVHGIHARGNRRVTLDAVIKGDANTLVSKLRHDVELAVREGKGRLLATAAMVSL